MKKYVIVSLFASVIFCTAFVFAEETKEEAIEPIKVVCPTTEEEPAPSTDTTATEATAEENK